MAPRNGSDPEVVEVEEEMTERLNHPRRAMLATLGIMALSQEKAAKWRADVSSFVGRLVERGESVEKDRGKMVRDLLEQRRKRVRKATRKAESELDKRVEEVIQRMNLPTRSDIKSLTMKVNALNRKVDALKQEKEKETSG